MTSDEAREAAPSTDEIRKWAAFVPDTTVQMRWSDKDASAFDRCLASVRAEAWDEGERDGRWNSAFQRPARFNPYREEGNDD